MKGKIVLCDKPRGDDGASSAGAVGSILKNEPFEYDASIFLLPASSLSVDRHDIVASYINSTKYGFLYNTHMCCLLLAFVSLNDLVIFVFYFTESLERPF